MKLNYYTNEKNVQIVISLLKAHGIKRIIASPGTTNMTFVVSVQNDPWFEVWSSVDERSAAYIACGLASETGEPVVISCTGATASRNYMPGMTEAYYRKLPILAITSTRGNHAIGHLIDQQIDRRNLPNDIAIESVTIPTVKDATDEAFCQLEANKAMLALSLNGGGPVHINLYTTYSNDFSVKELPPVNVIRRHTLHETLPPLPRNGQIAVYVGSHSPFTERQTKAIEKFCATYDAAVFCDHTSGYRGRYEVHFQLAAGQRKWRSKHKKVDLLIHIGEVTGDPYHANAHHVWRVSPDGALRNTYGNLRRVFMMPEEAFFEHYAQEDTDHHQFVDELNKEYACIREMIPELPFSNIWIAHQLVDHLPKGSDLHLGIYHSLRAWDFFKLPESVSSRCNVGGFGIDGGVSSLIGASLANPQKLHFGVFGDLAFFYDMNSIGNRHVGNNIRILLINNGKGNEFRNYGHYCHFLGEKADDFVAAAGHYGNQSPDLVRGYSQALGYEYLTASNKDELLGVAPHFLTPEITDRPMLLEVFTETDEESKAIEMMLNLLSDKNYIFQKNIQQIIVKYFGQNAVDFIKRWA